MRVVVRRRLSPEELREGLARLRELFPPEELEMAIMEYEEDGEVELSVEEEVDGETLRRLASPRMLELLGELSRGRYRSISDLARALGRSAPNVYADLKFLEERRLVFMARRGRLVVPVLLLEEVRLEVQD